MSQLSITVDTTDQRVVREVSEMLLRLSGHAELPMELGTNFTPEVAFVGSMSVPEFDPYLKYAPVVAPATETYTATEVSHDGTGVALNDVDTEGLPWDARIHSGSREKIANGTWKLKRGVDKDLLAQVKAELLGNGGTTPNPISENTAPQAAAPTVDSATPPPPPPPPPPPSEPMQQGATPPPATFAELMQRVTANKVPLQKLQAWCTEKSLGSFTTLGQHPDRIAEAAAALGI